MKLIQVETTPDTRSSYGYFIEIDENINTNVYRVYMINNVIRVVVDTYSDRRYSGTARKVRVCYTAINWFYPSQKCVVTVGMQGLGRFVYRFYF